jgi:Cyclin
MPGDVLRYAPYVNTMAPLPDPNGRQQPYRPFRFTSYQPQQQQPKQRHHPSPAYYPPNQMNHQMNVLPSPVYPTDARHHSSRGWEYSSPISNGYLYFTPPASNGPMLHVPMIPTNLAIPPPFVAAPQMIPHAPPRLPDRRVMPYGQPSRGFWVDQFASVDVHRQEPLPQDWHPFVDAPAPPPQPAVTGGVMAVLDYELNVMAEFLANVSCNFINIAKPWTSLTMFVEKVLNQTRLPSATVILGVTYLARRLSYDPPMDQDPAAPLIPTTKLYEYLTMSLLLANKFLDDNTFTNTSWSDISGIPRHDINVVERDWLKKLGYSLHVDPLAQKGWRTWQKAWETWQFDATGKGSPALLSPVLSRSNSSVSAKQMESDSPAFPSLKSVVNEWSKFEKPPTQFSAYLTPPISPTFDTSLDSEFLSPITPPPKYQWPPSLGPGPTPYQPQPQMSWQPLPNTRNIPTGAQAPLQIKYPIPHQKSRFWEPERETGSPWCECRNSQNHIPLDQYHAPQPRWVGMT